MNPDRPYGEGPPGPSPIPLQEDIVSTFTTRWVCETCGEQSIPTDSTTLMEADNWGEMHDLLTHGLLPQMRNYRNSHAKAMFVWEDH